MRAKDRREFLLRLIADSEVSVETLANRLHVTPSTIRRDLARLTSEGKVTRTYGGAVISADRSREPTLQQRAALCRAEKNAIGRWSASQVAEGETVILDAGTTTGRVAHHLRDRLGLTVVTNGVTTLLELLGADDVEVVALGGTLRHISQGFVGPLTEMMLDRLSADRLFLGADGLVADRGICEFSTVQTRLKELMATRAREIYVVADHTKLGHAPFNAWAPLERPWTLVTDDGATAEQLAPFHQLSHAHVVVVPVVRDIEGIPRLDASRRSAPNDGDPPAVIR
jgi:DeoR/GlpR family transcriptional regulator of sugar metabolism